MTEICPDAYLLNLTNPLAALTRAVSRQSGVKVIGLCHEVGNWCLDLAIVLGLPAEAIRPTVAGVNHLPVVTALEVDGEDGFEVLAKMVDEAGGLGALAPSEGRPAADPMSKLDFLRRHVGVQELTVEAALGGSRRTAAAAYLLDPLAGRGDFRRTEAMVDDLLAGTAQWLPGFVSGSAG